MRKYLVQRLVARGGVMNSPENPEDVLPNLVSVSLPVRSSRALVKRLAAKGIAVSTGSACHLLKRSETLKAIGLPIEKEKGTVRIGLSSQTTKEELDEFVTYAFL
eukprot:jgi/Mesvir1/9821/Mv03478-RA.1